MTAYYLVNYSCTLLVMTVVRYYISAILLNHGDKSNNKWVNKQSIIINKHINIILICK